MSGLLKSHADDYHKVLVNALSKEQSKSAKLVGLDASQQAPINEKLFARDNLKAWCIIPLGLLGTPLIFGWGGCGQDWKFLCWGDSVLSCIGHAKE